MITSPMVVFFVAGLMFFAVVRQAVAAAVLGSWIPYRDLIQAKARRHGISPVLLAAVVSVESSFRADARNLGDSGGGSFGLCQLKLATARDMIPGITEQQLMIPEFNLEAGAKYLSWIDRQAGLDLPRDIGAYNVGIGAYRTGQRKELAAAYAAKINKAMLEVSREA